MNEKFLKPYNHLETEDSIYSDWLESGLFNPDTSVEKGYTAPDAETFSIVLPPPNVTGTLHTGHAAMLAIEDIMVRFHRMSGYRTLWIPGTDHAAIATQSKVEKIIEKEGIRKSDMGRDAFLKRVEQFAQDSHDTIVGQVKKMGASIDWSREAFTLDTKREFAVRTAFKRMYDDGLIYRKNRIVNWDPKGQTTISDDEIVYQEEKTILYTFKYSKDFPIPISTTRPETKLGDTGVAVHPEDPRYKQFIGEVFEINDFAGEKLTIRIVGDEAVDMEYGTGAVGVTPAHSHIDAEIAGRHDLPSKQVINEYGKIIATEGTLANGMKVKDARLAIAEWLKEQGLMIEEKEVMHNIATAERSGGIIEPLPKLQWFIDVSKEFTLQHSNLKDIASGSSVTLKQLMLHAVDSGSVTVLPDRFNKTYFHWINNLRDWCISRQIWYGHRIPVWYKGDQIHVGTQAPDGDGWEQDQDTLDTWFSSGLWTFSTLGWPEETDDLKRFHPTSVLETGYDILFFWVARMILMSTYLIGDVPFKTVYLHGLVRDEKGRKMSKSLGNIIDPLDLIQKYGADAVRMALIIGNGPGNDTNLAESKINAYRKFANKLWNVSRFVLENTSATSGELSSAIDIRLYSDWKGILADVTDDMKNFRYYLAGEKLYHYVWHTFADQIIEESKPVIANGSEDDKNSRRLLLSLILSESLKSLHPFMPYITEEIWKDMPTRSSLLLVEKWPL